MTDLQAHLTEEERTALAEHVSCCAHLLGPHDHRHTCIGGHRASERVGGVTFWPCPIIAMSEALAEARAKIERIEAELCVCGVTSKAEWAGCLVHDKQSPLAAILGGSG